MSRVRTPFPTRIRKLGIALAALAAVLAPRPAGADWPPDNLRVCPDVVTRARSASVADGAGGAIVVFEEDYRGEADLYVQRVNSSGSRLWGSGAGIPLCTATGAQRLPVIVADGSGGAVIAWQDSRGAASDIYAQRINASGAAQWTANGVALCTAANSQSFPVIAPDGSGGAIVAWLDGRSGAGLDVYARRINSAGAPQWTADGVALCISAGNQLNARIVGDALGGAIVVWQDPRGADLDVYAQRLSSAGTPQWTANGLAICVAPDDQDSPAAVADGSNGVIVAWRDGRSGTNTDLYAQRVSSTAFINWAANGVPVCVAAGDQGSPALVSDASSGAVIAWDDARGGNSDVYAQRLNGSGTPQWTADGVAVCAATGDQIAPQSIQDGSGGAILIWSDHRGADSDLYARRISGAGAPQWTADGVPLGTATGNTVGPDLVADGFGGAIATWDDNRAASDVYARRVDNSGGPLWTADGVRVCTESDDQQSQDIVADGAGGAIVVWEEQFRSRWDLYAQRFDASGVLQWAANGVAICTAAGDQITPAVCSDGSGGAIVAWSDARGANRDIYVQRVNGGGVTQWTTNGVALCVAAGDQLDPHVVSDQAAGAIVVWQDQRSGNADVFIRRVSSAGVPQWTVDGVLLCSAINDQYVSSIDTDGASGAIAAWEDHRGATADVYARRVSAAGAAQWAANGVLLCGAIGDQTGPMLVADGAGGAIATWADGRPGADTDIYARRINGVGTPLWAADGVPVCTAVGRQFRPYLVADATANTVIAWTDIRDPSADIYSQRLNGSGTPQWTADGVALCTEPNSQATYGLVRDGSGSGAIAAWVDNRYSFDEDVFSRAISSAGAPQGVVDGAPVTVAPNRQVGITMISDGAGGALLAWQDFRSGTSWDVYAHRLGPLGPLAVPPATTTARAWLGPAFPNPTSGTAELRLRVAERTRVSVGVYDLLGRRVRGLIDREIGPTEITARWDGRDDAGRMMPAGIYLCVLRTQSETVARRLVRTR